MLNQVYRDEDLSLDVLKGKTIRYIGRAAGSLYA
jgi:hypothetical protein